jgi:hypothetical protein
MTHRGYGKYFEDTNPDLRSRAKVDSQILEGFSADPRIVSALPVIHHYRASASQTQLIDETQSLEQWADQIIHESIFAEDNQQTVGINTSNSPGATRKLELKPEEQMQPEQAGDNLEEMNRRGFLRTGAALALGAGLAALGIKVNEAEKKALAPLISAMESRLQELQATKQNIDREIHQIKQDMDEAKIALQEKGRVPDYIMKRYMQNSDAAQSGLKEADNEQIEEIAPVLAAVGGALGRAALGAAANYAVNKGMEKVSDMMSDKDEETLNESNDIVRLSRLIESRR